MAKKQITNQLDIINRIDAMIAKTESIVDELLAARLKEILATINEMYGNFVESDETSYTELNKYNRLSKELERISNQLNDDYKKIVKEITESNQHIYVEQFLMSAYLFQMYQGTEDGFSLPSEDVIAAALINPLELLQLPKVLEMNRDQTIRNINLEISQSLLRGEGYWKMAERLKQTMKISRSKARTIARTEGGRAMSIADEAVTEEMRKYAEIECIWLSTLDTRTRHAHRDLDGQKADKDGYFHYKGMKAKGPHMWHIAHMDINCRCVKIKLVNGQLPAVRSGRDYKDAGYQKRLKAQILAYMKQGMTYAQAYKKANNMILPPNKIIKFITFEEYNS